MRSTYLRVVFLCLLCTAWLKPRSTTSLLLLSPSAHSPVSHRAVLPRAVRAQIQMRR